MKLSADHVSGAFFFLFGLAMILVVNPAYIEEVSGGNTSPNMLPNAVSIVIAVCGALLILKPTAHKARTLRSTATTGLYVGLLVAGLYAISHFGFEYVAPVLALAIMVTIGERRPLWLVLGAVAIPALIWFLVVHVLGRALP
jgi:putative tricarboxylic transport membrane protein